MNDAAAVEAYLARLPLDAAARESLRLRALAAPTAA